jgi:uncharacterized membrane protein
MTLDSSKNLGGIGAILLLIGIIGLVTEPLLALAGIVGAIMLLVGLHGLANYYKESSIFNNALFGFISLIIGGIVGFASLVYLLFATTFGRDFIAVLYPGFNGDWTTLPNLTINANFNPADLVPFVAPILSVWVIFCIFLIGASVFTWLSLKHVAAKTNVALFSTAGIILLIGAFLTIIFIGAFLMLIALLLVAIAFFQIHPPPLTTEPTATQPAPV